MGEVSCFQATARDSRGKQLEYKFIQERTFYHTAFLAGGDADLILEKRLGFKLHLSTGKLAGNRFLFRFCVPKISRTG